MSYAEMADIGQKINEKDRLPALPNLAYHIIKSGNNVDQLVKLAHHENKRSPDISLEKHLEVTDKGG